MGRFEIGSTSWVYLTYEIAPGLTAPSALLYQSVVSGFWCEHVVL